MHIAVAGNIGCGKTTLTNMLAKHYGWEPRLRAWSITRICQISMPTWDGGHLTCRSISSTSVSKT